MIARRIVIALLLARSACIYSSQIPSHAAGYCSRDEDCKANEKCDFESCRTRCNTDADCGGTVCSASGACSAEIGAACDQYSLACGSAGECKNVNAQNRTVPYYCTWDCFNDTLNVGHQCPYGYVCTMDACLEP